MENNITVVYAIMRQDWPMSKYDPQIESVWRLKESAEKEIKRLAEKDFNGVRFIEERYLDSPDFEYVTEVQYGK